jgi:hypothetical protein
VPGESCLKSNEDPLSHVRKGTATERLDRTRIDPQVLCPLALLSCTRNPECKKKRSARGQDGERACAFQCGCVIL